MTVFVKIQFFSCVGKIQEIIISTYDPTLELPDLPYL